MTCFASKLDLKRIIEIQSKKVIDLHWLNLRKYNAQFQASF